MPVIQIATPFNIDIEFELADFHKRLLAYLLDFILLFVYLISMLYFLFGAFSLGEESTGFVILAYPVLQPGERTAFWGANCRQKSFGNKSNQPFWRRTHFGAIPAALVYALLRMGIYFVFLVLG
jgi:hypothetical protein